MKHWQLVKGYLDTRVAVLLLLSLGLMSHIKIVSKLVSYWIFPPEPRS